MELLICSRVRNKLLQYFKILLPHIIQYYCYPTTTTTTTEVLYNKHTKIYFKMLIVSHNYKIATQYPQLLLLLPSSFWFPVFLPSQHS